MAAGPRPAAHEDTACHSAPSVQIPDIICLPTWLSTNSIHDSDVLHMPC